MSELDNNEHLGGDRVNHAMFSIHSARPKTFVIGFEGFGLAYAVKWRTLRVPDKFVDSCAHFSVCAKPVKIIVPSLLTKTKQHAEATKAHSLPVLSPLYLNLQR